MERKTKKIRVTIVNFQGGAKKVVVVDAGDWDSLIRQTGDKFRIRTGKYDTYYYHVAIKNEE
jgi:hypothetical protein